MTNNTTQRSIRIPDPLWGAAQKMADQRGDNLSEVIRRALELYADNQHPTWGSEVSPKNNAHIASCPQCQRTFR